MSSKKSKLLSLKKKIKRQIKVSKGSKNELASLQSTLDKVNVELARLTKLHGKQSKHRRGTERNDLLHSKSVNIKYNRWIAVSSDFSPRYW